MRVPPKNSRFSLCKFACGNMLTFLSPAFVCPVDDDVVVEESQDDNGDVCEGRRNCQHWTEISWIVFQCHENSSLVLIWSNFIKTDG